MRSTLQSLPQSGWILAMLVLHLCQLYKKLLQNLMAKPNHSHAHRSCGFLGTAPPCSSQYQLEGGLKMGDWNLVKVAYSHVWCLGWKHPNSWGRKSKASQASLSTLYGCPAWQFQRSSASLIVAQGSKGPCPEKGRERQGEVPLPFMTQSWRPQNVTSISLYLLKGKHSQGEGN